LPADEPYPNLPAPVALEGTVSLADGTPVAAGLVFEALSITDANGQQDSSDFEFIARAQTKIDAASSTSRSHFAVAVPQGVYRLSVRPIDPGLQVTVLEHFVVQSVSNLLLLHLTVDPLRVVDGFAKVMDGRPLAGATIEAVPVACVHGNSPGCAPRAATTSTTADGAFELTLDPGQYVLRVEPAQGSHLPWAMQPLLVGQDDPKTLLLARVPAPVDESLRFVDPSGTNPIARAIVRLFQLPPGGVATEVGRSITDANGSFEMVVAPPPQ
jgi:hypothetical protein